jgi:hypothetical protein
MENNNPNETYTFEKVWKMFAETDKQMKEGFAELREMFAKSSAEEDKRAAIREAEWAEIRKSQADTDRRIKEQSKNIGGISKSNGDMAEEAICNLFEKDMMYNNIRFDKIHKNVPVVDDLETLTELDIMLVNCDTLAILEVKYKAERKDVIDLLEDKLVKFRKCFPAYSNYKVMLGIGGMSFDKKAIDTAKAKGIGIIKVIGDKVELYTDGIKIY